MSLILVDLSSIFWQQWHATSDQEVGEAAHKTLDKVHRLTTGHDHVAICCDAPPYKRKDIYADYKAQRDQPAEVAVEQFSRVKRELSKRYPVLSAEGYEADDIIASIVAHLGDEIEDGVTIASGDKDLMQLVTQYVTVLSVQTGERYGPDEVVAKWGVQPTKLLDLLSLCGDKSDNVPGVPRVGPKTAAKLLHDLGTLEAILNAAAEPSKDRTGAIWKALAEHSENARLAKRLITLSTDAPVDIDSIFDPQLLHEEPMHDNVDDAEVEDTDDLIGDPIQHDENTQDAVVMPASKAQSEPSEPKPDALATVPSWELALEPNNSGSAYKLARLLYESRMFGQFPTQEAILAVILRGRALGLDSTTSLSNFHIIQGRPVMSAALLIGVVLNSGKAEYLEWVESDSKHSVWITKRVGGKVEKRLEWTVEDACSAGLLRRDPKGQDGYSGKDNWDKYRAAMLRWRCGVELARSVFPDVCAGIYTKEEFE